MLASLIGPSVAIASLFGVFLLVAAMNAGQRRCQLADCVANHKKQNGYEEINHSDDECELDLTDRLNCSQLAGQPVGENSTSVLPTNRSEMSYCRRTYRVYNQKRAAAAALIS
jgi:hypothetical protein